MGCDLGMKTECPIHLRITVIHSGMMRTNLRQIGHKNSANNGRNKPFMVKDMVTGKVYNCSSSYQAQDEIGLSKTTISAYMTKVRKAGKPMQFHDYLFMDGDQ